MEGLHKLSSPWEGPFTVAKVTGPGSYRLRMLEGEDVSYSWNIDQLCCRMDLLGPTISVGTRTDYSMDPWDYPACATRHRMAWSKRTTEEKYSVRKLYMSRTV
jgi:hypothetical protein